MNHKQHKFTTTLVVFVIMIIGIFVASRFQNISLGVLNISLLLANSILLLIILGILLQMKESQTEKTKKKS